MDEDDEFGDLYTDVFRPAVGTPPPPPILSAATSSGRNLPLDLNLHSDDEDILYGASDRNLTLPAHQTLTTGPGKIERQRISGGSGGGIANSIDESKAVQGDAVRVEKKVDVSGVLDSPNVELRTVEARVSEGLSSLQKSVFGDVDDEDGDKGGISMQKGGVFSREEMEDKLDIEVDVDDMESEPVIPGLFGGSFIPGDVYDGSSGADAKASVKDDGGGVGGDEWDSDSEDDLQIVLNDKPGPPGLHRNEEEGSEDDDEDGEDLVIVADGDQLHQPIEEQEWGDDSAQAADGERKEPGEPVKANGAMVGAVVARIGYSSHGYHPHHSQFKYVRPGAAVIPGGTLAGPAGATVQVRPPVNIGPIAGRGRGDWRPIGLKNAPNVQKTFHSGYGMPTWAANSSGRGFGGGLEFTLPSHKTVFDIDIDSFEEKPWRHPGVETSDFFNFGLDEEKWKYYCKQLEQLRLEATMQSKIRVYESGRSEQDYDPDLPPELAAATGIHDASVENAQFGKTDGGQSDPMGQGRGARNRPPIPTGRAIQVEGGYGERLPSIDTRPPRIRDSDAIIEIVLQGSLDDDPMTANDAPEQPDCGLQGADVKRGGVDEDNEQNDNEYFDRLPQNYSGRKREMVGRRESVLGSIHDNVHEGDGILPVPPETLLQYPSGSKGQSMVYPGEIPQNGRWPERAGRDKYPHLTAEHESEASPTRSFPENRVCENQMEKSGESIGGKQTSQSSSLVALEGARESSVEFKRDLRDELALDESSVAVEREEMTLNIGKPGETIRDGSPSHSSKKQKLSSRVEQTAVQDIGAGDDLRGTRSSDNSKVRSSSSRDYNKRRDGGEEEVVQEGHSKRMVDTKRHRDEDEHTFQRRDEYARDGRHEMDRNHIVVKGREDSHHSHHYRDWDPSSAQASRAKTGDFERLRERDSSVGSRQRRDDDMHGRRVKEEDMRKRERVEEMGSRHRIKVREGERGEKDEYLHSRKWLDNGDWRSHHEKDVGSRQRERDDNFSSWHEKFDDSTSKRRKDEEHQRREQADREISQGYKAREDTGRRKRERDDSLDHRRREDQHRVRDKPDDSHSVRNRDDSWRQREREDRQRLKIPHEDMLSAREREGRGAVRSGRAVEDKSWVGNVRTKDEPKSLGFDKDYPFKDKRRQGEPSKRSDRKEDDSLSQHRGRENVYARENQFNIDDRNLRHEKSSTHNDHGVNASDNQLGHKERHRESRKGKESEGGDHYTLGSSRRKQEDHSANRGEKGDTASKLASTNSRDPGQSRLSSSAVLSRKSHHEHEVQEHRSSRKHRDDAPSDDEQQDLRRGRSKLERWTSHKDRDDNTNSMLTSSKDKETGRNDNGRSSLVSEQVDKTSTMVESVNDQHPLGEDKNSHDAEDKDANTEPTSANKHVESDKAVDDRHLDTVAKLKKRSERFKTPMPSEKEASANRKMDGEAPVLAQTETAASTNAEIKPERPARKRRWISS